MLGGRLDGVSVPLLLGVHAINPQASVATRIREMNASVEFSLDIGFGEIRNTLSSTMSQQSKPRLGDCIQDYDPRG
jgi:hypothetical protein